MSELGAPNDCKLLGVIGLGHRSSDEVVDLSRFTQRRRKFDDMVHRNRW